MSIIRLLSAVSSMVIIHPPSCYDIITTGISDSDLPAHRWKIHVDANIEKFLSGLFRERSRGILGKWAPSPTAGCWWLFTVLATWRGLLNKNIQLWNTLIIIFDIYKIGSNICFESVSWSHRFCTWMRVWPASGGSVSRSADCSADCVFNGKISFLSGTGFHLFH